VYCRVSKKKDINYQTIQKTHKMRKNKRLKIDTLYVLEVLLTQVIKEQGNSDRKSRQKQLKICSKFILIDLNHCQKMPNVRVAHMNGGWRIFNGLIGNQFKLGFFQKSAQTYGFSQFGGFNVGTRFLLKERL